MVEYNTICIAGPFITVRASQIQNYVGAKYQDDLKFPYGNDGTHTFFAKDHQYLKDSLFAAGSQTQIKAHAGSFVKALELYCESVPDVSRKGLPRVLIVIEESSDRWTNDYKTIEMELMANYSVYCMRASFPEIAREARVDPESNILYFRGKEIGLVYFRAGFEEGPHIVTKAEDLADGLDFWKVREMIELSMPIKLPSIDFQLATFKKFQQQFSDRAYLDKVAQSEELVNRLGKVFSTIWSMENLGVEGAEINEVYKDAIAHPENYYLKPQKEGGGNNLVNDEIRQKLQDLDDPELKTYIIQKRIVPPLVDTYHCVKGGYYVSQSFIEIGIASSLFTKFNAATESSPATNVVIDSQMIGMFCKSKDSSVKEAEVCKGTACLTFPLPIPTALIQEKSKGLAKGKLEMTVKI